MDIGQRNQARKPGTYPCQLGNHSGKVQSDLRLSVIVIGNLHMGNICSINKEDTKSTIGAPTKVKIIILRKINATRRGP